MIADLSHFKPLFGIQPKRFIARHPAQSHLILQTDTMPPNVGIWDETTGDVIWQQSDVLTLMWNPDGSQLALVRRAPTLLETANEERFVFERRLWPANASLGSLMFELPWSAQPFDLWSAANCNLAAIRWIDEGFSGWEPIILLDTDDVHLPGARFVLASEVAIHTHPSISPDGHYAVSGYHSRYTATEEGNMTLQVKGRFEVGRITVVDIRSLSYREIVVHDAVPAKLHGTASRWIDQPVFLDNTHFTVVLPTGSRQLFIVNG